MPLLIDRRRNEDVIIGDHSVVSVVEMERGEARLAFHTIDDVKRVDRPETVMEAARIKARAQIAHDKVRKGMEPVPVYVGFKTFENGEVDVRASLKADAVDVAGYRLAQLGADTNLAPQNHQFIVVRCLDKKEIETIEKLILGRMLNWRLYEKREMPDATTYALFIHATKTREGGDVRYVDLLEM